MADDACGVPAVLGSVNSIEVVVDVLVRPHEDDVSRDGAAQIRPSCITCVPRNQAALRA